MNWLTTGLPSGYTVTQGSASPFPGCSAFITAFGTCFGNNTATPYILIQPPLDSPNNLPTYMRASPFKATGTSNDDFSQLGEDEAFVAIVTLPPQGAYLGYQTYMLERSAAAYTAYSPPTQTPPCTGGTSWHIYTETPDCNYVVFGTFTNTINNGDIANIAGIAPWNTWVSGAPTTFNTIAIITTANKTLAANLIAAYTAANVSSIFVEKMPAYAASGAPNAAAVLNVCNGAASTPCDVYGTLLRYTLADPTNNNGPTWVSGSNVLVYRVKQPSSMTITNSDLYEAGSVYSGLFTQGCNTNETGVSGAPSSCSALTSNLDYDLQQIAGLLQTWGNANNGDSWGTYQASGSTATSVNGGVGSAVVSGRNASGATQDNNFYRSYQAGILKNQTPVFVVGALHSASSSDFTSPTAPNNADYTGISIADNSTTYTNTGVDDAANPNSQSEYTDSRPNRFLLGSAYSVLNFLTSGPSHASLYSQLPTSVQNDINDIYIHVFLRNDTATLSNVYTGCTATVCSNSLSNDSTIIMNGTAPASGTPSLLPTIPDLDPVLLTERGYLLPVPPGATTGTGVAVQYLTGAAAQYLESPYVVCDTHLTGCAP